MEKIDDKYIQEAIDYTYIKNRRISYVRGCILVASFFVTIIILSIQNRFVSTTITEPIMANDGCSEEEILILNPKDPSKTYAYPTVLVNGEYYEFRRTRVNGVGPLLVVPNGIPKELWPDDPNVVLEGLDYYGEIIHYSGEYQYPKEDCEIVCWFDIQGQIYTDPNNKDTVYLYIETPWIEYAVAAFDKIEKPK
ncbi:MAG: hypothetical protein K6G43_11230 [Lachnospiraceae bacterium]|nr:hypothetical protein [Lachnospiraceae bacterium]